MKQASFTRDDAMDVIFTYDFDDPRLVELDAAWHLRELAGAGDTQARALNLLHWLCAHTRHGNPQSLPEGLRMNAQALLGWAYDQPGNDPNGKHLCVILSECLLAVGIKAYALWCFPKVDRGEKHVVVQAWLPEGSRWIMLDPTFDSYFTGEAGRVLSAPEARECLRSGALRNPSMVNIMYYFSRARHTKCGMLDEGVRWVYLCPAGYGLKNEASPVYATRDSFWR